MYMCVCVSKDHLGAIRKFSFCFYISHVHPGYVYASVRVMFRFLNLLEAKKLLSPVGKKKIKKTEVRKQSKKQILVSILLKKKKFINNMMRFINNLKLI